jgi:hypothetical protein
MTTIRAMMLVSVAWLLLPDAAKHVTAQEKAEEASPDTLQTVLDRIHKHAANKTWRGEGWKDERIETWVDGLTGKVAAAANFPALKAPVHFADVKPTDEANSRSHDHVLLVGKNFRLLTTKLRNCLVLADGNFLADSVQSCVIVARGAISVTASESSILIGGAYVRSNSDGQTRNLENGSLFVTPGWAHADTINGSLIYAGEGITTGRRIDGGVFINATLVLSEAMSVTSQRRPRSVKVRDLTVGDLVNNPLSSRLDVTGVIYPEAAESPDLLGLVMRGGLDTARPRPIGLILRFEGRRYVVNIGKAIVDQNEQPVESLAGWKLSYVNDKMAIFSNSQADAIVRIEG